MEETTTMMIIFIVCSLAILIIFFCFYNSSWRKVWTRVSFCQGTQVRLYEERIELYVETVESLQPKESLGNESEEDVDFMTYFHRKETRDTIRRNRYGQRKLPPLPVQVHEVQEGVGLKPLPLTLPPKTTQAALQPRTFSPPKQEGKLFATSGKPPCPGPKRVARKLPPSPPLMTDIEITRPPYVNESVRPPIPEKSQNVRKKIERSIRDQKSFSCESFLSNDAAMKTTTDESSGGSDFNMTSQDKEIIEKVKEFVLSDWAPCDTNLLNKTCLSAYEHCLNPFAVKRKFFPPEHIRRLNNVGNGSFGMVYKAKLQLNHGEILDIALKTIYRFQDPTAAYIDVLNEAYTMLDLQHPNVLSLVGISIDEYGCPMILTPFMEDGDLRKFLLNQGKKKASVTDLFEFAVQVAQGMKYLAERHIVHRDLAARNCMLSYQIGFVCVKVADFGMSRILMNKDYYRMRNRKNPPLPVKWMAVESLETGQFSEASDVWSYGVVLWELMTYGAIPYPVIKNSNLLVYLKQKKRLQKPENCPHDLYKVMRSCWRENPQKRPNFETLAELVKKIRFFIPERNKLFHPEPTDKGMKKRKMPERRNSF